MSLPFPHSKPMEGSLSPLHMAACMSSEAVERMLSMMKRDVTRDALVDIVNAKATDDEDRNGGYTALHYACQAGLSKGVRLLIEAGANPNIRKNNGATPLICSISSAGWNHRVAETERRATAAENISTHKECIRMLLDHPQLDLQQNDKSGDGKVSPAWMCVAHDFLHEDILLEILDMLLARGFDANGTKHNRSALHMALLQGHEQCAHKLVRAGADIYTTAPRGLPGGEDNDDEEPWTALEACRFMYGKKPASRMEEAALAAAAIAGKKTRLKILRNSSKTSSSNDSVKILAQKSMETAEQLAQVGRWGAASAAYEEALGYGTVALSKKDRYKALINVSGCLAQSCRPSEAVEHGRRLVTEFPDSPMSHISLATSIMHHGNQMRGVPNPDEASKSCEKAEKLLARCRGNGWWLELSSLEEVRRALEDVKKAIPDKEVLDHPACQAAGIALDNFNRQDGDIVKAAQAIDRALDPKLNHPNPLAMRLVRASIYYQLGTNRLEVAIASYSGETLESVFPSLQKLALEDPWARAKENYETALADYEHCLLANHGRSLSAWNSGLSLVSLCRFDEGSAMCLQGLGRILEDQIADFERVQQENGHLTNRTPMENSSNKDFIIHLEQAFENARMLIETREKSSNDGNTEREDSSGACCDAAAVKLRADCAATVVDSVLQAHRRLKSAVSTRVVGTLLKEALDWDASCEIPEELQKAQRKVVPELRCAVCGTGGPMQSCPCKEAHYCRKECQVKAWKEHKRVCKFHRKRTEKKAQKS